MQSYVIELVIAVGRRHTRHSPGSSPTPEIILASLVNSSGLPDVIASASDVRVSGFGGSQITGIEGDSDGAAVGALG
jgi:hypothetical protein